jgi:hypothetical protein
MNARDRELDCGMRVGWTGYIQRREKMEKKRDHIGSEVSFCAFDSGARSVPEFPEGRLDSIQLERLHS